MPHRPNQLENYAIQEQYNPRTGDWLSDTKDILLRFLQDFFFQFEAGTGLYHFEPGDNDYGTDEKETELIITDAGSIDHHAVEKRPAIVISRGPFAWGNTSFDQLLFVDNTDGKRTHTDLLSGSFVLNCISRRGLEAERVALLASKGIRIFRRNLQKAGFFYIGHLIQVGSETPANAILSGDADEDFINVPVTFPVYYQESWTVEQNAPELSSIVFKVHAIFRTFSGDLLVPDAYNPDGSVNEASEGVIVGEWII
jgi:hypothetical protein